MLVNKNKKSSIILQLIFIKKAILLGLKSTPSQILKNMFISDFETHDFTHYYGIQYKFWHKHHIYLNFSLKTSSNPLKSHIFAQTSPYVDNKNGLYNLYITFFFLILKKCTFFTVPLAYRIDIDQHFFS